MSFTVKRKRRPREGVMEGVVTLCQHGKNQCSFKSSGTNLVYIYNKC